MEPRKHTASDGETGTKATDEDVMINGVKGSAKIQRYQQGQESDAW